MDAKEHLKDIFRFAIYKLDNNLCTPEEIESWAKAAGESIEMNASIPELANFFGVSEQNIRSTINRKLITKPKRRVLYPFLPFLKVVPAKWRRKAEIKTYVENHEM